MKLTLIGNGKMAQALISGLIKKYEIEVLGRNYAKLQKLQEKFPKIQIKTMTQKEDIADKNIIFCVKPYVVQSVASNFKGTANSLYSILAGIAIESLKKYVKAKHYIRAMPNIAALKQKSMTTIIGDEKIKEEAIDIFSTIGKTLWVENEKYLNIATSLSSGGPAFLALVADGLIDGAVKLGLNRESSEILTQGLLEGFSALLEDMQPISIKNSVISPGGTTIEGVAILEEAALRGSMMKAVEASYLKALKLAKE